MVPCSIVEGTTLNGAVVVVELNPDEIEPGRVQSGTEVGIRVGALWSTGNVVLLGSISGIVSAHLINESGIASSSTTLNIQVETVNDSTVEGASSAGASTKEVPELIGEGGSLSIGRKSVASSSTTYRSN